MSFHNGVLTYIPESCSHVDPSDANLDDSSEFQPGEISYWTGKIGSMIPGLVLGGICAVGFLLMLLWICVRCCRRRKLETKKKGASPGEAQFLTGGGMASAPPAAFEQPRIGRRRRRWANLLTTLMLTLAVGVVGTGAWAMGESIKQTNDVISSFWDVVHQVNNTVNEANSQLGTLSYSLALMQPATSYVRDHMQDLAPKLAIALELTVPQARHVLDVLAGLPQATMTEAASTINVTALPVLQDHILQVVYSVLDFEDPTMSIQDQWRFVILAVLFGLLILAVIGATALCFYMRFGRWASFAVALVWFLNALVMLGGVGLMNGVVVISDEACLYAETYFYHISNTRLGSPTATLLVNSTMDYYFGVRSLPGIVNDSLTAHVEGYDPALAEAIFNQLTGADLTQVLIAAKEINDTVGEIGGVDGINAKIALLSDMGVDDATVEKLQDAVTGLSGVLGSTQMLVETLRRASVEPIYHSLKAYLCCNINTAGHWMWVSWTVAGSIALAYCLLASARVVWQTILPEDRGWTDAGWQDPQGPQQLQQQGLGYVPPAPAPPAAVGAKSSMCGASSGGLSDSTLLSKSPHCTATDSQAASILAEASGAGVGAAQQAQREPPSPPAAAFPPPGAGQSFRQPLGQRPPLV